MILFPSILNLNTLVSCAIGLIATATIIAIIRLNLGGVDQLIEIGLFILPLLIIGILSTIILTTLYGWGWYKPNQKVIQIKTDQIILLIKFLSL